MTPFEESESSSTLAFRHFKPYFLESCSCLRSRGPFRHVDIGRPAAKSTSKRAFSIQEPWRRSRRDAPEYAEWMFLLCIDRRASQSAGFSFA